MIPISRECVCLGLSLRLDKEQPNSALLHYMTVVNYFVPWSSSGKINYLNLHKKTERDHDHH